MTNGEFMLLDGPDQMMVFERLNEYKEVCDRYGVKTPKALEEALRKANIRPRCMTVETMSDGRLRGRYNPDDED